MKYYKKNWVLYRFLVWQFENIGLINQFQLFKILTNYKIEIYYLLILDLNKPDSYFI